MAAEEAMLESLMGPGMLWIGGLVITIAALALLSFIVWIWMLLDCIKREKFRNGDRTMWVLLLVLTGGIGMILYYIMEMHGSKK